MLIEHCKRHIISESAEKPRWLLNGAEGTAPEFVARFGVCFPGRPLGGAPVVAGVALPRASNEQPKPVSRRAVVRAERTCLKCGKLCKDFQPGLLAHVRGHLRIDEGKTYEDVRHMVLTQNLMDTFFSAPHPLTEPSLKACIDKIEPSQDISIDMVEPCQNVSTDKVVDEVAKRGTEIEKCGKCGHGVTSLMGKKSHARKHYRVIYQKSYVGETEEYLKLYDECFGGMEVVSPCEAVSVSADHQRMSESPESLPLTATPEPEQLSCQQCTIKFPVDSSSNFLKKHVWRAHMGNQPPVYCSFCKKCYSDCDFLPEDVKKLMEQCQQEHPKNEFTIINNVECVADAFEEQYYDCFDKEAKAALGAGCKLCGAVYKYNSQMETHVWDHLNQVVFECLFCGYTSKCGTNRAFNGVKRHMQKHNVLDDTGIADHRSMHKKAFENTQRDCYGTDDESKCALCGDVCKRAFARRQHVWKAHVRQPVITCNLCSYSFMYPAQKSIEEHIRSRHGGEGHEYSNQSEQLSESYQHLAQQCFPASSTSHLQNRECTLFSLLYFFRIDATHNSID